MTKLLTESLPLLAAAPNGISKVRELILSLAVRGRLVAQDSNEQSAHVLVKNIRAANPSLRGIPAAAQIPITDAEKRFAVPASWTWVRFGFATDSRLGKMLDKAKNTGEHRPYLRNTNVQWARFDLDDVKTMQLEEHELDDYRVLPGDLLICEGGEPGRCAVWRDEGRTIFFQKALHRARPLSAISSDFIQMCLRVDCSSEALNQFFTGATIKHLPGEKLTKYPMPLPPLAEQHRIVAKVDELIALCDRLEAQQADAEAAHAQLVQALLASLTQARDAADFRASWQQLAEHFHTLFTTEGSIDALKQAVVHLAVQGKLVPSVHDDAPADDFLAIVDAARGEQAESPGARRRTQARQADVMADPPYESPSGWQWRSLGSLLNITGGVTLGRKLGQRQLVSLPYLRVANVQRGFLVLDQVKEVELPADEVEKYRLVHGDLLTTEGGDWDKVGRTAIWRDEIAQCLHQNHVFRLRPYTEQFSSRWVELYLNSAPARGYFAGSSKQTTNLASINMTQLRACAFPVPPLAEQLRIVNKVDDLLALCDRLKQSLATTRQSHEHLATVLVEQAVA